MGMLSDVHVIYLSGAQDFNKKSTPKRYKNYIVYAMFDF